MSFGNDTDRRRKSDPSSPADAQEASEGGSRKKRPARAEYGTALRNAYRQAVEEDIPPEMLDLLGKLS